MAGLQSLRILTQISAGKCTNFGIVALIHLSVDTPVFNLDGLGFPGKLLWVRILIAFDTILATAHRAWISERTQGLSNARNADRLAVTAV